MARNQMVYKREENICDTYLYIIIICAHSTQNETKKEFFGVHSFALLQWRHN